ncbi:OmpA family protein [Maribacter sp. HTCC2170]|uniref:OmpA family protein n=1 Tax=Maribacter sp. (strain HTCC2170 / KCCM 42371) TaxID=313603 RepID=UPI00006BD2F9|nr:OmpA family protein [Maribacter sp. HTCC2170]EAR02977.1 OmpA domain protein [Maribacter sp. HTCC2170]
MTKRTTNLLGIIITILAGTYFYITCCSECGMQSKEEPEKEVITSIEPKATSFPFSFSDGDFTYSANDNFNFNSSSSAILTPVSQGVEDGIESLKSFLDENSEKVFNINGYYTSDEENDSAFPNLGLARANAVKNYFVSKGIPSKLMNTLGQLKNELVPNVNLFSGPLGYSIANRAEDADEQLADIYQRIKGNPISLEFNTAEASINLRAEQRQKFANISRYLDKEDDAVANIVGHTDNTGQRDANIKLGQERADFAKSYLMRNGIPESRINATSKGPDEPIASNDTEEGRAKNRRTVITLN